MAFLSRYKDGEDKFRFNLLLMELQCQEDEAYDYNIMILRYLMHIGMLLRCVTGRLTYRSSNFKMPVE